MRIIESGDWAVFNVRQYFGGANFVTPVLTSSLRGSSSLAISVGMQRIFEEM